MLEFMYILNYSNPGIYKIKLDKESCKKTPDEILKEYGLNEDECSWMFTDKELELETINKVNNNEYFV